MIKRALILGGSSGIGRATLMKIATIFDEVIVVHRDRKQGVEDLANFIKDFNTNLSCKILTYNIDATDRQKAESLMNESSGPFHLVVHAITRGNLGSLDSKREDHLQQDDLHLTMDAMCFNVQMWNSLLLDHDLLAVGCRFITLTSEGSHRYSPGYGAVAMAKSALETLTKYLAVEMSTYGVRYICIHAGVTDTPSLRLIPNYKELIGYTKSRNPYKSLTSPEDVAGVIFLLTQPEADWINGSIIHVDGGEHLV